MNEIIPLPFSACTSTYFGYACFPHYVSLNIYSSIYI